MEGFKYRKTEKGYLIGRKNTEKTQLQDLILTASSSNDLIARRHAAAKLCVLLMKRNGIWRESSLNDFDWKLLSEEDFLREVELVGSTQDLDLDLANMCAHCMGRLIRGAWQIPPIEKTDDFEVDVIELLNTTDDPAVKVILLVGLTSSKTATARNVVVAATADSQVGIRKSANYLVERMTANSFGPLGVIHIASPTDDVDASGRKIRAIYRWDKTLGAGWGPMTRGLQTKLILDDRGLKTGQNLHASLVVRNVAEKPIKVAMLHHLARLVCLC